MGIKFSVILAFVVLAGVITVSQSFHPVFATTTTLDGTSCTTLMGSWDGSTNTCTINGPPYVGYVNLTTSTSDEFVIPSGTTLVILNPNFDQYRNIGTITNHGTIQLGNPGGTVGIQNDGTINNYGTITISNTGSSAIINSNTSMINNYGTITINNSGDYGIDNNGLINNSGIINALSASSIHNSGILNNNCGATYSGNLPIGNPVNNVCVDTIPPVITAPADITMISLTPVSPPLGTPTVSDNLDPSPIVTNNAPTSFAPGTITIVIWTATDHSGNSASAQQTINIQTPLQATQNLLSTVNGMHLKKGTTDSLDDKLQEIIKNLTKGHGDDIKEKLNAFIHEVKAQTGKSITISQSTQLTNTAQAIINALPTSAHHDKDSE